MYAKGLTHRLIEGPYIDVSCIEAHSAGIVPVRKLRAKSL